MITFNFMGLVCMVSILGLQDPDTGRIFPGILFSSFGAIESSTFITL